MATNYVKANYTEIIDLQTVNGKTSIIGIHTPQGSAPYFKLRGFFQAFRQYRYRGIRSLTLVPAAQLPVDPLGLTGVVGTTDLMDPRDMMNPIISHGCHGDSMDMIINRFYANNGTGVNTSGAGLMNVINGTAGYMSSSADCKDADFSVVAAEQRYYNHLTDPTWRKYGIQSGVRMKYLRPLVWKLAQSVPLVPSYGYPQAGQLVPSNNTSSGGLTTNTPLNGYAPVSPAGGLPTISDVDANNDWSNKRAFVQQFTNGVSRLGWLPTISLYPTNASSTEVKPSITLLPKLFMMMLVLPPSYNVEQFFRLSIVHTFEFRGFTTSLGAMDQFGDPFSSITDTSGQNSYFNWIDYTDEGGTKVVASDPIHEGTSLDVLNGESQLVSDGAM